MQGLIIAGIPKISSPKCHLQGFQKVISFIQKYMEKLFSTSVEQLLAVFVAAFTVYILTIFLTRITGKRSFAKLSSFDFAMTVAVGALIGTTILSPTVSLMQGVMGLASLYLLQHLVGFLRRFQIVDFLVTSRPILLMKGPQVLEENLKKAHVTEKDLQAALRKANIADRSQVLAVVFETSGDISILHSKQEKKVEKWLMEGVDE